MHVRLMLGAAVAACWAGQAGAAEIALVTGATGSNVSFLEEVLPKFEEATGHTVKIVPMPSSTTDQFGQYRLWLAAGNSEIDVYLTDVIWAPQLADQFLDLGEAAKDIIGDHFPAVVESQTVDGKLVAIPMYTAAPALFYRKDLLDKHGEKVPATWEELTATAERVMAAERAENPDLWGYVWQGNAYEGLTCDALEWVKSFGGGEIVSPDGTITIDNDKAAAALDTAKSWVGTISPPGVLAYGEEESRGVWQTGNAVFMRNWPYAFSLGNGDDSPIKGKFDVATLPAGPGGQSAATLGGWNVAVSKYSKEPDAATELALFLTSTEIQKARALVQSEMPTIVSLYDDPEIIQQQPIIPRWKDALSNAVARPSGATKLKYNEVSSKFWTAVHDTLSGNGSAADNLELLAIDLEELKGSGW
jgi:trehalose/maltose transport system substrate-binding protein